MTTKHQQLAHPGVHRAFSAWSEEQTLHVATMYSNPQQWPVRRQLFYDFRKRTEASPNVRLYVGEVAFGDRPFEATSADNPRDFQFRTSHELWLKENVLNLVVARVPPSAKYLAYLDGDVVMSRYDWALETVHQLQHYAVVQLFSQFTDVDYRHRPYAVSNSFAYAYSHSITPKVFAQDAASAASPGGQRLATAGGYRYTAPAPDHPNLPDPPKQWWGATGLGWAFRRSAWDTMGGLFDMAILGSADWIMAYGMVGLADGVDYQGCPAYYQAVKRWQVGAQALKANVWYVDNHITHFWHGPKANRFYGVRERILMDNAFDPYIDLKRDAQGLWQLAGNKPKLRDDIRAYFRARNEMDVNLEPGARLLA